MQTGLEDKPWYFGAAIGLVVAVLLFLAANSFLFKPREEQITRLEDRRANLQATATRATAT